MQLFNFTPQETKALIFLLAALLVGSGITLYKRTHPQFAPELVVEGKRADTRPQSQSSVSSQPDNITINVNRASAAQLQLLPGVGPTLSKRIVEYRESKGKFERIEDLMKVQGIGAKTFQQIREYVTVD